MSVCLESNNVLANQVSTASPQIPEQSSNEDVASSSSIQLNPTSPTRELNDHSTTTTTQQHQQVLSTKTVTKLLVSNHQTSTVGSANPVLQKITNPPVITVLNSSGGPLTVLKTICVTSGVSSAPQFSLVNNNQSLNVTNAIGKTPTITLLNAPVTVVKVPQNVQEKQQQQSEVVSSSSVTTTQNVPTIIENRSHNVFVKNTCTDSSMSDVVPQSHKFLTANSFPQNNVITPVSGKTVNGQRSKLKILSNVIVPTSTTEITHTQQTPSIILNKPNAIHQQQQQRMISRQKILTSTDNQIKYSTNSMQKSSMFNVKQMPEKIAQQQQPRMVYPTHKSQIKTIAPTNNYLPKVHRIKTLTPQQQIKGGAGTVPGHIQRTGSGLRTIPPQRPPKLPNKLNYIGKHAVQAQKIKASGANRYNKNGKQNASVINYNMPPVHTNKQLAFNQALTAEILETLSNNTPSTSYSNKNYEILPSRYDVPVFAEQKPMESLKFEDKTKSGLDTLSLICQAVLLDHNYNATLPPDSPTRMTPIPVVAASQMNGMSSNSMLLYSPPASSGCIGAKNKYQQVSATERKRTLSCSNPVSSSSSVTSLIHGNSTASLVNLQDDDAASDISDCCSDRKHDTEGEETDTAPEAEAVANDEPYDHYGDYVTRCICGFLHDDGYMVECDRCKVWQHVQCVIKNRQVPDEFLCEKCDSSKPVDPHRARLVQQQWLRERQQLPDLKNFKKDKLKDPKHMPADSDSSDIENPRQNVNSVGPRGRGVAHKKRAEKLSAKQKKDAKDSNAQRSKLKKRERKLVKRKSKFQTKTTDDEGGQDAFAMSQLPQLRQWIENYEEAVTNHYSPELRARISNLRVNGAHTPDTPVPYDSSVNKCRVHTQPLTDLKYLMATEDVPADTPVIELRGKYMLSTQHRNSGGNATTRQHAQRPGPFLFFYRLHKDNTEVCVDTRTYGNSARFIRRSCKPNAELRHCIVKGVLHLYIVTLLAVEKNAELTIKHESHDLAAIGTTQIACYCGHSDDCKINKSSVKKNGEAEVPRKKRGRRAASLCVPAAPVVPPPSAPTEVPVDSITINEKMKEENTTTSQTEPSKTEVPIITEVKTELSSADIKKEEPVTVKEEPMKVEDIKLEETVEIKEERAKMPIVNDDAIQSPVTTPEKEDKEPIDEKEVKKASLPSRRTSQHKMEKDKDESTKAQKQDRNKNQKLSREERKLEAILRAIEQMEKADQRKQEHKQTKHVQRRESEPALQCKDDDKPSEAKQRRKRRKGRSRTTSTHSARRDRLNSGDSYVTSGDENLLSPNDSGIHHNSRKSDDCDDSSKHDGFLLALSSKHNKSPLHHDSNSNSAHSSPETQLSLACSLVQAAVEPLESGFKFPKTKKVLMNEWLNKTPESSVQNTPSPLSPQINSELDIAATGFYTPTKNNANQEQQPTARGSAKKRWLRQAISEDKCESPQESPPLNDSVAPPKKRKLPRESISNDNTPPSTPTNLTPSVNLLEETGQQEEIIFGNPECDDSPSETLESDAVLKERAEEMKQEFGKCAVITTSSSSISDTVSRPDTLSFRCLMDPRLRNHHPMFSNSDHLVGTVEKTLSILGFDERKPESVTPAKRKLSITEYRQRKKLNNNDSNDKPEDNSLTDECMNDDNNSSEYVRMQPSRPRLNSTSSTSSITSSDEEVQLPTSEIVAKAPAFNSEPTELERQREMQSLRLKKAFGLAIDVEPRKTGLNVEAILNCDLPIKSTISDSPNSVLENQEQPTTDSTKSASNSPRLEAVVSPPLTSPVSSTDDLNKLDAVDEMQLMKNDEHSKEEIVSTSLQFESGEVENETFVEREDKEKMIVEDGVEGDEEGEDIRAEEEETVDDVKQHENDEDEEDHEVGEEDGDDEGEVKPHMFYTPDEEEEREEEEVDEKGFPDVESISYVPPFNNPIYPSTNYTSLIDEEGRYEGRNPSPPPSHLESIDSET